jgi:hypothetical protein
MNIETRKAEIKVVLWKCSTTVRQEGQEKNPGTSTFISVS